MRRLVLIARGLWLRRRTARLINAINATPVGFRHPSWHADLIDLELGQHELTKSLQELGW